MSSSEKDAVERSDEIKSADPIGKPNKEDSDENYSPKTSQRQNNMRK